MVSQESYNLWRVSCLWMSQICLKLVISLILFAVFPSHSSFVGLWHTDCHLDKTSHLQYLEILSHILKFHREYISLADPEEIVTYLIYIYLIQL